MLQKQEKEEFSVRRAVDDIVQTLLTPTKQPTVVTTWRPTMRRTYLYYHNLFTINSLPLKSKHVPPLTSGMNGFQNDE